MTPTVSRMSSTEAFGSGPAVSIRRFALPAPRRRPPGREAAGESLAGCPAVVGRGFLLASGIGVPSVAALDVEADSHVMARAGHHQRRAERAGDAPAPANHLPEGFL